MTCNLLFQIIDGLHGLYNTALCIVLRHHLDLDLRPFSIKHLQMPVLELINLRSSSKADVTHAIKLVVGLRAIDTQGTFIPLLRHADEAYSAPGTWFRASNFSNCITIHHIDDLPLWKDVREEFPHKEVDAEVVCDHRGKL